MNSKLKNAIIFIVIAVVMLSVYFVFIKKSPEQPNLTTESTTGVTPVSSGSPTNTQATNSNQLSKDFLEVLLSIKSINLDDAIFSDIAFLNLKDSTILLVPDGSEGRPNPFAPIGTETSATVQANALGGFNLGAGTDTSRSSDITTNIGLEESSTTTEVPPKTTPAKTTTPKR